MPPFHVVKELMGRPYPKRPPKAKGPAREELPIYQQKDELIRTIREHPVVIVVGETGCGKTTQLPQYIAEAGFADTGLIGVTQPRRISAITNAKRVAAETGSRLGDKVGFHVRFKHTRGSVIEFMTDGMLLQDIIQESNLSKYSVIILDEAHERSINTDILFGLVLKSIRSRVDLKLVITSATLDTEKFTKYFSQAPLFKIPGLTYDVEIIWRDFWGSNIVESSLAVINDIHKNEGRGDILVFLTGKDEIDQLCESLEEGNYNNNSGLDLLILPLYAAMPIEEQKYVFDETPDDKRKVVIATNIAETSLTIDGIVYVVDPGFIKYKIDCLVRRRISQQQAIQRMGRAGRTADGKVYRLYSPDKFKAMAEFQVPEITRCNLYSVVLQLMAIGITNPIDFNFMDPPNEDNLQDAIHHLETLGAIEKNGTLTEIGEQIVQLPMEPLLAKMLLVAEHNQCSTEMLTIVAMLNVSNIFFRPKKKRLQADMAKASFTHESGDHMTLLKVYTEFENQYCSAEWCKRMYLRYDSLWEASDIRKQLSEILYRMNDHWEVSCGADESKILKSLTNSLKVAVRTGRRGQFRTTSGEEVYIHPCSVLFKQVHMRSVIFTEITQTSRSYIRNVTDADLII